MNKGICRSCKKHSKDHYGDKQYCYGDSKSKETFISYKWKNKHFFVEDDIIAENDMKKNKIFRFLERFFKKNSQEISPADCYGRRVYYE